MSHEPNYILSILPVSYLDILDSYTKVSDKVWHLRVTPVAYRRTNKTLLLRVTLHDTYAIVEYIPTFGSLILSPPYFGPTRFPLYGV